MFPLKEQLSMLLSPGMSPPGPFPTPPLPLPVGTVWHVESPVMGQVQRYEKSLQ